MSRRYRRSVPGPGRRRALLACAFAGVLAAGAATGSWGQEAPPASADARSGGDAARLVEGSGDRWAAAYTAEEYQALRLSLEGEYIGTGIVVRRCPDGRIEVRRVRAGSPAERAGVLPGDLLHAVDGEVLDGRPVTVAVSRLRGSDRPDPAEPGSPVMVELERAGERWAVELERALLAAEPVTVERDDSGVTRVRVSSFVEGVADRLRAAVAEAPAGDGIVLDLRGNPGGLLGEAAGAASVFLDGGLVATYDVHGEERALHAEAGGDTARALVVLVDGGTMSSAELLAGALQDRNRALVVGRPTFGKGTVQMPSEQPDGTVAELTVGEYATPSGVILEEGRGIVPDVLVEAGGDGVAQARSVLAGLAGDR